MYKLSAEEFINNVKLKYLKDLERVKSIDLLRFTKKVIKFFRLRINKDLGQHFVINPRLIKSLIQGLENCKVFEIGSGIGTLTYYLAQRCKHLITIDIDYSMLYITKHTLANFNNCDIYCADVLSIELPRDYYVVSNTPYSITSPLILKLVKSGIKYAKLTLQYEVGKRICAKPGTGDYGRLTIITQCFYNVKILSKFTSKSFYPEPEVDSVIIEFIRKDNPCIEFSKIEQLEKLTNILFSQRNKIVRKVLSKYASNLPGNTIFNKRVYELSIDEIIKLMNYVNLDDDREKDDL